MEDNIYYDIRQERALQDQKWGSQRENPTLLWAAILTEEVGEVNRAILDKADAQHLRAELVQVAAVAVAWMEAIDNESR